MPKITTIKRFVKGQPMEFQIWYTQKDLFHFAKDETKFLDDAGVKPIRFGYVSQANIEQSLDDAIKAYESANTQRRKVIFLATRFPYATFRRADDDDNAPSFRGMYKRFDGDGHFNEQLYDMSVHGDGLVIDYIVGIEESIGDKKNYFELIKVFNEEEERKINRYDLERRHMRIIDWTPEREAFLKSITDSLYAVAVKVRQFFPEDIDETINNIDTHGQRILSQFTTDKS